MLRHTDLFLEEPLFTYALLLAGGLAIAQDSNTDEALPAEADTTVEAVEEAAAEDTEVAEVEEPAPALDPMQLWQGIADTPALVEYFKDSFDTLGVAVEGTEHSLTVTHTGTALELTPGIADDVDFRVTITAQQVMNMVENAEDNQISEQESWRILDVLFTPMTAVTLDNEVLTNNRLRKAIGVEDLTHVSLLNPSGEPASSHTLFYVKGQWVVVSGLHGTPRRTYTLTPAQALEYQKKIFSAMRANDRKQWKEWAKWYVSWRDGVSVTHAE